MSIPNLLSAILHVYALCMIARAIFSWFPPHTRQNSLYEFLFRITEPVLGRIRKMLPPAGGIDFSPLIAIVALEFLSRLLAGR